MTRPQNYILAALELAEREALLAKAVSFPLVFGATILEPDERVDQVYFPESGVISIITETEVGEAAEGGVTGSEGAAGLPEALGSGVMRSRGVVQAEGVAWRVQADVCRAVHHASPRFREAAARSAEFQVVEARQSLLCRSYHTVDRRLARWLLEMAGRGDLRARALPMTQEILGVMLAVQRTTVSAAATRMRKAGLISYLRGRIVLTDIDGLEALACSCRAAVREAELEILGRETTWPSRLSERPSQGGRPTA
jgi:CRP-like cAMP-binding protein